MDIQVAISFSQTCGFKTDKDNRIGSFESPTKTKLKNFQTRDYAHQNKAGPNGRVAWSQ